MKVLKFGGTSVGSEEAIRQVARIVHSSIDQLVLVTSAVGGVTDQLVHIGELAASGRKDYASFIEGVKVQHEQLYYNLIENKPDEQFYKIIEEFEDIGHGHARQDEKGRKPSADAAPNIILMKVNDPNDPNKPFIIGGFASHKWRSQAAGGGNGDKTCFLFNLT